MTDKDLGNLLKSKLLKKEVSNIDVIKSFGNNFKNIAINLPGAFYAAPTWVRKNCPEESRKG